MSPIRFSLSYVNLVMFFLTLVVLSGCGGDDDNSNPLTSRESAIVGTWKLTKVIITDLGGPQDYTPEQVNMSITFTMNSDKTFSSSQTIDGQNTTQNGTWVLNGSQITLVHGSEIETIPYPENGNKFEITIYIQDGDILNSRTLEFTKQ